MINAVNDIQAQVRVSVSGSMIEMLSLGAVIDILLQNKAFNDITLNGIIDNIDCYEKSIQISFTITGVSSGEYLAIFSHETVEMFRDLLLVTKTGFPVEINNGGAKWD